MSLTTLEAFDAANAAKRIRLIKDSALAHALPTAGVMLEWTGETGWDSQGNPLEPATKSIELGPYIVHGPTAYKAAEHVGFRAPSSCRYVKECGEHISSKYRDKFVRSYLLALLNACELHMVETVAVREPKSYSGFFPDGFDYRTKTGTSYPNGVENARGYFVVRVGAHVGQYGYSTACLEFYISHPEVCKVSFDLDASFFPHKLLPCPRYTSNHDSCSPASWSFTGAQQVGAVELYKRASVDRSTHGAAMGYDVEYLFPTRAALLAVINA